ncbi:MAG TPA: hypothetical protein VNU69_03805 [Rhizomicrobium sp.]|nr:hypothetical protein [Rhizomicrobium sp.]
MKKLLIASCMALALPTAAFADVAAELTVADQHAGFAAKATTIDMVHMHLHHSLNCLVGPAGTGFDTTVANPCAKQGNGAIPDSTDAAQKAKLQTAVGQLNTGLAATDMTAAAKSATDASTTIGGAKM